MKAVRRAQPAVIAIVTRKLAKANPFAGGQTRNRLHEQGLARELADFPLRAPRLRNPRQGWSMAREFAEKGPFQRRR